VKFSTLRLTPAKDVYEGKPCEGVKIEVTDRAAVRSLDLFTHAAYLLRKYNGKEFVIKPVEMRKMTGSGDLYDLLQKEAGPAEIIAAFETSSAAFMADRKKYLLYD